jgi:hypothetical protein
VRSARREPCDADMPFAHACQVVDDDALGHHSEMHCCHVAPVRL